jgi:hypothetical protein
MKRRPLPKRNPARKAREFTRTYGGSERVKWVQSQPCVVCGVRPCENAHVKGGGAGRKADARWIVSLCHGCHAQLHTKGQKTFEQECGVDLMFWAQIIDARWEVHVATQPKPEVP